MSFRSSSQRSRKRRILRQAIREHSNRRPRFETLEDRCLLSFSTGVGFANGTYLPFDLVSADFNNDGHLDLVAPTYYPGKVSVLLGNGHGGFGEPTLFEVGNYPRSVAVGDFNEDGNLDLAAANQGDYSPNYLPSIGVLLGNGDGTFAPVKSIATEGSASSVAVGDFNGDGHLDLGVGNNEYSFFYFDWVTVHLGDGEGNFAAPMSSGGDIGILLSAIAADLNGDGADDLVLGDNRYASGASVFLGGDASGQLQLSRTLNFGASVGDVAIGDLNHDGVPDIVTANTYSPAAHVLSVFLADGQGGYGAAQNYFPSSAQFEPFPIALGDFTGDGHVDIVHRQKLFRGNGDGTFSEPEPTSPAGGATGDFNEDGWLDIASFGSGYAYVYLNSGDWGQVVTLPGDFNGDDAVDGRDFLAWQRNPSVGNLADWQANYGRRALPTLSLSDAAVTEGNVGTTNATFTVTLSKASAVDVTVRYDTADSTALAGIDYTATSGMVTIPAGEISRTFTVAVLGDHLAESNEFIYVELSEPTGAIIGKGWAYGTILDDEPRISINDVTELEGRNNQTTQFVFVVTLSVAYDEQVTMSYQTYDSAATTSDNDYLAQSGTLTFAPGETTKTVAIDVKGDNKREDDEWFYLYFSGNSINSYFVDSFTNSVVPYVFATGTILNDD